MPYRKQNLAGYGQALPKPPLTGALGLRPLLRHPAVEVMRAQDKVTALSRRVVLSYGLHGSVEWRVPNVNPQSNVRTHPDRVTWYTVARSRIEVTPGCFYRASIAYVPSGETQRDGVGAELSTNAYWPDGVHGAVRITITWTDRDSATETTTREIILPGSTLQYGAEDVTDPGGFWRTLASTSTDVMMPPDVMADPAELYRFCRHVTATITVEHQGSPRVVDLSIYEVPVAAAIDTAATAGDWHSHFYATASPDGPGVPELYPMIEASASNPSGGATKILETARAQVLRLGPCLLQWTAYNETDATATAGIVARTTANDGTTFESLIDSTHTGTGPAAYDADLPGWSVSCGGYARRWASGNHLVLRDKIACVPVIVRVYGRTITAGTGTVRVQTALHSYVDVDIAIGAAGWHRGIGWLEVGIAPEQPTIAQVFINHLGASGSLELEAVEVYYNATAAVV